MDWVLVTEDTVLPDIPISTKIEIFYVECASYIVGTEFEVGKSKTVELGSVIWYNSTIHAYRLLEKHFAPVSDYTCGTG